MSWELHCKNIGPANKGLNGVHMRVAKSENRNARVIVTVGLDVVAKLGWPEMTKVHLFIGKHDHAGKIRLVREGDGSSPQGAQPYTMRRKGGKYGSPQVEVKPWEGMPQVPTERESCQYEVASGDLYVTLPTVWSEATSTVATSANRRAQRQVNDTLAAAQRVIEEAAEPEPITLDEDHNPEEDPDFDEIDQAVTPTELAVLRAITEGGTGAKSVARMIGRSSMVTDIAIGQLRDQGLVTVGRGAKLSVTEDGLAVIEEATNPSAQSEPKTLPAITPFQTKVLQAYVKGVADVPHRLAGILGQFTKNVVDATNKLVEAGYVRKDGVTVVPLFDADGVPVKQEAAAE